MNRPTLARGLAGITLTAAVTAALASPAAAGAPDPTGPAARVAQYESIPFTCSPMISAGGRKEYKTATWGPNGGLGSYKITVSAWARKCKGRTLVQYALYWNVTGPSSRTVNVILSSSGPHTAWKHACVKVYGGGTRCVFQYHTGSGPRFGAQPIGQWRTTRGGDRIKTIGVSTWAEDGDSHTGYWLAGSSSGNFALSKYAKLG